MSIFVYQKANKICEIDFFGWMRKRKKLLIHISSPVHFFLQCLTVVNFKIVKLLKF
jgi:hypothetical protein